MFGISGAELIVILLVALVVLGPDKLPSVARKAGSVLGELRKVSAGFEAEMRSAMFDQPGAPTRAEPSPDGNGNGHAQGDDADVTEATSAEAHQEVDDHQ